MAPGQRNSQIKRRRLQGACDICRQRKIRCDSAKMPDNRCTNCIEFGADCTHVHVLNQKTVYKLKPLRPPKDASKPDTLAEQQETLGPLLDAILAPRYQAPTNPAIIRDTLISLASYIRLLEGANATNGPGSPQPSRPSPSTSRSTTAEKEAAPEIVDPFEFDVDDLAADLQKRLDLGACGNHFYQSASGSGESKVPKADITPENVAGTSFANKPETKTKLPPTLKRPQFWVPHKPAKVPEERRHLIFPEPDLMEHVINLYFRVCNLYTPIIHRPTFERSLRSNLHLRDPAFGECVLAMCAVGARYSSDPRVIPHGESSERECGSQWYRQIRFSREKWGFIPSLYELQTYHIALQYVHGTSTPETSWYIISLAIRAAQSAGIHRRDTSGNPPTVESELRKRVWWALVTDDIGISFSAGRPRACQSFDQDIDLPIDCDDAYWEHPDPVLAFKQPSGKPSTTAAFIKFIEVHRILASAQRAFYSVRKPEPHPDLQMSQEDFDYSTLLDLHAQLNHWADTVPNHLRWDPNREHSIFFDQSAAMYITYYWVQIVVHRQFTAGNKQSAVSFAISTNAAIACSRMAEVHSYRGIVAIPQVQRALLNSGLIILLAIWRAQKIGVALNLYVEMDPVHRCSRVLSIMEQRWHPAGLFNDVLRTLAVSSNLPFPQVNANAEFDWNEFTASTLHAFAGQAGSSDEGVSAATVFENFAYPVYQDELSKPLFQSYQHPSPMVEQSFAYFQDTATCGTLAQVPSCIGPPTVPSHDYTYGVYDSMQTAPAVNVSQNLHNIQMDLSTIPDWAVSPTGLDWAAWNNHIANFEILNGGADFTNPPL